MYDLIKIGVIIMYKIFQISIKRLYLCALRLDSYPLYNCKSLDFLDFKKAAYLYKADKKFKTEQIKEIISNMNSKRETNK